MPLHHHFEPKKNAIFDRHKFRQNIERTNESSINFATRLCKLASTFELKYQNPTLVIRQSEEMQAGIARLKVAQDKYDFPSTKCCFCYGSSTYFANKCNLAKGKTYWRFGTECHFVVVCEWKPQKLPVNLLQNESPPMKSVIYWKQHRIMLNNALPVEFLIDSGSSVNIFNQDTFTKLDSLMSMTLDRSFAKVYQYGCKIPLPKLRKIVSSKFIRTITTKLLKHFMSLTLQHCVFLANLHWSYLVFFECSLANQVWANCCIN